MKIGSKKSIKFNNFYSKIFEEIFLVLIKIIDDDLILFLLCFKSKNSYI